MTSAVSSDRQARAAQLIAEKFNSGMKNTITLWELFSSCLGDKSRNEYDSKSLIYLKFIREGEITPDQEKDPWHTTEAQRKIIITQLAQSKLELR